MDCVPAINETEDITEGKSQKKPGIIWSTCSLVQNAMRIVGIFLNLETSSFQLHIKPETNRHESNSKKKPNIKIIVIEDVQCLCIVRKKLKGYQGLYQKGSLKCQLSSFLTPSPQVWIANNVNCNETIILYIWFYRYKCAVLAVSSHRLLVRYCISSLFSLQPLLHEDESRAVIWIYDCDVNLHCTVT